MSAILSFAKALFERHRSGLLDAVCSGGTLPVDMDDLRRVAFILPEQDAYAR